MQPSFDLTLIKRQNGVPEALDGRHTTLVGGYVVEGHVPVAALEPPARRAPRRSRASRCPACRRAPPGCSAQKEGPLTVYEIAADAAPSATPKVFAVE